MIFLRCSYAPELVCRNSRCIVIDNGFDKPQIEAINRKEYIMYDYADSQVPVSIGSIDMRCRIMESTLDLSKDTAETFGLTVENSRLYPKSANYRQQWKRRVQEVFDTREPKYVVVREYPVIACALLTLDFQNNIVRISMPKTQVCQVETANRVGELMGFTKREKEVVLLLAKGCDTNEVADVLGTQLSTVRSQIKSVMLKSGISGMKKLLVFLSCLPEIHDYDSSKAQIAVPSINVNQ